MATFLSTNRLAVRVINTLGQAVLVPPGGSVDSYGDLSVYGFQLVSGGWWRFIADADGRAIFDAKAVGDVSGNGSFVLPATPAEVFGRYIQKIITNPAGGADAPGAYTIVVTDSLGVTLFTVPTRSTTATERYDVASEIGRNEILDNDWTLTLTGMGNGNIVSVTVIFD